MASPRDQPVVEVLTDKADSEVPSPVEGVVTKLLAQEDEVVRVGAGLCIIDENGAGAAVARRSTPPKAAAPKAAEARPEMMPAAPASARVSERPPAPPGSGQGWRRSCRHRHRGRFSSMRKLSHASKAST